MYVCPHNVLGDVREQWLWRHLPSLHPIHLKAVLGDFQEGHYLEHGPVRARPLQVNHLCHT